MLLLCFGRNWQWCPQHHDGITGTAKDHVVLDYGDKMVTAIRNLQEVYLSKYSDCICIIWAISFEQYQYLLKIYLFISGYFPICKFPFDKVASSSPTWSLHHILWPRWFQVCTLAISKRDYISLFFGEEPQNKYLMDESGYFTFEHYLTKVLNPKLMWQKTKIYQHINKTVSLTINMIC